MLWRAIRIPATLCSMHCRCTGVWLNLDCRQRSRVDLRAQASAARRDLEETPRRRRVCLGVRKEDVSDDIHRVTRETPMGMFQTERG